MNLILHNNEYLPLFVTERQCWLSDADVIKWRHFPHYWSDVRGIHPLQGPVTRNFDISFDVRLDKRLSKHSWRQWFETQSRSLQHHCNEAWPTSLICLAGCPGSACVVKLITLSLVHMNNWSHSLVEPWWLFLSVKIQSWSKRVLSCFWPDCMPLSIHHVYFGIISVSFVVSTCRKHE